MSAYDFAVKLLFERMKCKVLVVGENYHSAAIGQAIMKCCAVWEKNMV